MVSAGGSVGEVACGEVSAVAGGPVSGGTNGSADMTQTPIRTAVRINKDIAVAARRNFFRRPERLEDNRITSNLVNNIFSA